MTAFYMQGGAIQQVPTGNSWVRWKIKIDNQMTRQFTHPGLAPLEQFMIRSQREKRCIDCGEPSTDFQESILIKSVKGYYHCPDCQALYD